jgi:hypothetical protein
LSVHLVAWLLSQLVERVNILVSQVTKLSAMREYCSFAKQTSMVAGSGLSSPAQTDFVLIRLPAGFASMNAICLRQPVKTEYSKHVVRTILVADSGKFRNVPMDYAKVMFVPWLS